MEFTFSKAAVFRLFNFFKEKKFIFKKKDILLKVTDKSKIIKIVLGLDFPFTFKQVLCFLSKFVRRTKANLLESVRK